MSTPERRSSISANRKLTELTVDEMVRIATAFARSQTFKNRNSAMTAEQIFLIILAGQELGLGPSQAVMGIKMIEGKPELSANTMAALVKAGGKYDYTVEYGTDEAPSCKIIFKNLEDGSIAGVSSFTKSDAETAGLWRNNYLKFWRNMLFARALSNGVKWYCPDALRVSAYHEGEIEGDTDAPVPELPAGAGQEPGQIAPARVTDRPVGQSSLQIEPGEARPEEPIEGEILPGETVSEAMARMEEEEELTPDEIGAPLESEAEPETGLEPEEAPQVQVEVEDHIRRATPAQRSLMRVKQRRAQLTDERYHEILLEVAGVKHTDKVPFELVDAVLKRLAAEEDMA